MKAPRPLPRSFYARPADVVAPELLGKLLVAEAPDGSRLAARLNEVEAYGGGDDPASHAFRGRTARNAPMFERPATLYVYFTYGMHWCMNAVCGPRGTASAVLLRGGIAVEGIEWFRARRGHRPDRLLLSGPARLAQAFAIDGAANGTDLLDGPLRIVDDGVAAPACPVTTPRIGLAAGKGDEIAWRFVGPV
jgi:DNA-3-methyladenine glycosylase